MSLWSIGCTDPVLTLLGYNTWVDLIIWDMVDFDIILGMDWLSPYYVV